MARQQMAGCDFRIDACFSLHSPINILARAPKRPFSNWLVAVLALGIDGPRRELGLHRAFAVWHGRQGRISPAPRRPMPDWN